MIFHRRRHRKRGWGARRGSLCPHCTGQDKEFTLADIPPGCRGRVRGFCPGLSAERLAQLQSYGLLPGYWVRVLRHSPVTLIQVEQTELALETELACEVRIEAPAAA